MGGSYEWEGTTTYTPTSPDPLTLVSPTKRPIRRRRAVPVVKEE